MKRKRNRRSLALLLGLGAVILLLGWILWGNTALVVNQFTIQSSRIPVSFSGYRIAQVSDLHNTEFGEDNIALLERLAEAEPDLIVLTGDLIDSRRTDVDVSLDFAREAVKLAPVYYVSGNHEARVPEEYSRLKAGLEEAGVVVLENEGLSLSRGEDAVRLLGLSDPMFFPQAEPSTLAAETLAPLMGEEPGYTILLAHRPELFETYAAQGVDLTLSGHTHGGQIRLPFLGAVYAPDQGLFPKYDAGLYTLGQSSLVISKGLGNSLFPFRINSRPELVLIELAAG